MKIICIVILSCTLLIPVSLKAQEPAMVHYTIDDGLPSNTVYNVYPDSKGYLWFGTDKGIARYNGTNFKNFGVKDGLPDNEVFSFKEDHEGRLWLATLNGKLCYYKNDTFYTAKNAPWLKIPPECTQTEYIIIEKDSSITFQFGSRAYLLNIKGNQSKLIPLTHVFKVLDSLQELNGITLFVDRKVKGNIYSGLGATRAILFDEKGKCLSTSLHPGRRRRTRPAFSNNYIYPVYNDSAYDTKGRHIYTIKGVKPWAHYCLLNDEYGIFMGCDQGLYFNDSLQSLKGHLITSITKDFQGNFWISVHKEGAYMLHPDFTKTLRYSNAYKDKIDHALRIGNHLMYVDKKGKIYRESNHQTMEIIYHPGTKYSFVEEPGNHLFEQGYAILSASGNLLFLDHLDQIPVAHSFPSEIMAFKNTMYNSNFWGIFANQIFSFDPFGSSDFSSDTLVDRTANHEGRISSSTQDEYGTIWFTYLDSVFTIKRNNEVTFQFSHYNGTLRKMIVRNNFVVAYTDANQLMIFNRNNTPAATDTLSRDDITWSDITPIDNTRMLLSSDKSYFILTLYPDGEHSKGYELLPVENIFLPKQAEYIYANKDYCYFFKNESILKIATSTLLAKAPAPHVVFTTLTTSSRQYINFSGIRIPYDEAQNIKLNFEAISYSSKELSYQYSLSDDGKDHWQATDGTELTLLVPSYGTYIIKVRAKTISGDYSAADIITLVIKRPYWATWWFWSVVALFIAVISWWAVQLRTRRLLHKKQQEFEAEKRYQQSEYKALNALMNPHFIFNSMNNIQGLINEDEKKTANEYLVIFSEMIRQNMHNIDQGTISLYKELALCKKYLELEKLRFHELVNYSFEIAEDVDTEDIIIPPLLLQPLIENAIRHGLLPKGSPENMVRIRIFELDNILTIEVEDNGIGLTKAAQSRSSLHQSLGLDNMRKRIAHIRKIQQRELHFHIEELINPDDSVKGTRATIRIGLDMG